LAERVGFGLFYPNPHKGRGLQIGVEGYILGGEMNLRVEGAITGNSLAHKKAKNAGVKAALSIIWSKLVLSTGRR